MWVHKLLLLPMVVSYLFCISFPRKVFTTLKPRWVGLRVPWPLASGCPCWCLSVHLPAGGQCQSTQNVWPLPLFLSCTLCSALSSQSSMNPVLLMSVGSVHKWIVRVIPFLVTLFAVISQCHLWACTEMHSSFLSPLPRSLQCQHDQHSRASELPGHSVSRWGFGQPTQRSDSSQGIPGKPTPWQHPKDPPFLMGFRPPWVPPLPV